MSKEYYSIKKVSNSSLQYFKESPRLFKAFVDKELEEVKKTYFEKGTMMHMYILEPQEFDKKYVFLDFDTPTSQQQKDFLSKLAYSRKKETEDEKLVRIYSEIYSTKSKSTDKILEEANELKKKYKNYIKYLKLTTVDKVVISESTKTFLDEGLNAVRAHKLANKLMFDSDEDKMRSGYESHNEFMIEWLHHSGIECKSLIDRLIIDKDNKIIRLVDVKTMFSFKDLADKFEEFGYFSQLAFYWNAIMWHCIYNLNMDLDELDEYKKETYIVGIKTKDVAECKVLKIQEVNLNIGLNFIEETMSKLKWHYDNNEWEYPISYYDSEGYETL